MGSIYMCCCQSTELVQYISQLFPINRTLVGYRPLGGLLLVLHLLLLRFTSLEILAVLLAQNGYQMQAAGIGESWPQRHPS